MIYFKIIIIYTSKQVHESIILKRNKNHDKERIDIIILVHTLSEFVLSFVKIYN